jgi:hypothetical protein
MPLKVNSQNKDTIEKLHLLTGESKETVRRFFESFAFLIATNYLENEWTNIPFFGDVKLHYVGDKNVRGGKRVQLELNFEPEDNLLRNIGQIEDGETSEVEKTFMNRIHTALEAYMSK